MKEKNIIKKRVSKNGEDRLELIFKFNRDLEKLTSKYSLPEELSSEVNSLVLKGWKTFDNERANKDVLT